MLDRYNRNINYLRISVTDRCNLRCVYCMPREGVDWVPHSEILSYDEIIEVVKTAVSMGVNKVRLTGGEPLVRKGIIYLVERIARIDGVNDFGMTTNGILLDQFALPLREAGLHRLNISLDTMDPDEFRSITRNGNLRDVLHGIKAALDAGFNSIKINCVIKESPEEENARQVARFCHENNLEVRFILQMNLEDGHFHKVIGGSGGDCTGCNRLRLTSTGNIIPCLFSDLSFNIKEYGIKEALELAVSNKPASGSCSHVNTFNTLGG